MSNLTLGPSTLARSAVRESLEGISRSGVQPALSEFTVAALVLEGLETTFKDDYISGAVQ